MRIESVYVGGFGEFSEFSLGPFEGPVTVVHGPNEAGKSTLLEFMRTVLFGFPLRNRAQYYAPTKGGQHGGRMTLVDDRNDRYVVERTVSTHGEVVRVVTAGGDRLEDDAVLRQLLGQASRAMFESVFAFGIAELQDVRSLSDSDVSGRIYSAGMGAGNLPDAMRRLDGERDKLFKPGGSNQAIAKTLAQLQQLDARLSDSRGNAAEYGRLIARREEAKVELNNKGDLIARLTAREAELDRLQRAWEDWVAIKELEDHLKRIPCIEGFPHDTGARLDVLEQRLGEAKDALDEALAELEQAEAKAEAPVADEPLLADVDSIDRIKRGRAKYDSAVDDLPTVRTELQSHMEELDRSLHELGEGWDLQRLTTFDTSVQVRDSLEQWREQFTDLERVSVETVAEASRASRELHDAAEATKEAETEASELPQPEFDATKLEEMQGLLRKGRSRLADYRLTKQRREELQYQVEQVSGLEAAPTGERSRLLPPLVAIALGMAAIAGGLVLGDSTAVLGVILGFALVAGAIYLHFAARAKPARTQLTLLRSRLEEAQAREQRECEALVRSAEPLTAAFPDTEALDAAEERLDRTRASLDNWNAAQKALAKAQSDERRLGRQSAEAKNAAQQANDNLEKARRSWEDWLGQRDLSNTLKPATAIEILQRVKTAKVIANQVVDLQKRVATIEDGIQAYRELVQPVAAKHNIELREGESTSLAVAAEQLITRLDEAQEQVAKRQQAVESAQAARAQMERQKARVAKARDELDALLKLGGTTDLETFRRVASEQDEQRELDGHLREREGHLRRLSGPGDQLERFKDALEQTTLDLLQEETSRLQMDLQEAQESRTRLLGEQGGINVRIDQLETDETASESRVQRGVLLEQLQSSATEWSILTIARQLLLKARARYEAERQPQVIKHAQKFFTTVTGGRYRRLVAPLGEQTVEVEQDDGRRKSPSMLSRGTREQLYLALRLGLVRQFAEQATALPVIIDEALVNFDPERGDRAVKGFGELAQTNQVLVFTCHPYLVQLFTTGCPECQVIEMAPPPGGISGQLPESA
jgi:uncharacterized protein YhaN